MRIADLLYLAVMLSMAFWGLGKLLARQFEKRLDEKFKAQAEAREAADKVLADTLSKHLAEEQRLSAKLETLDRDFRDWKGELPIRYVLREDYIRGQVTIEHKLDEVHKKSEAALQQLQRLIGKQEGGGQ